MVSSTGPPPPEPLKRPRKLADIPAFTVPPQLLHLLVGHNHKVGLKAVGACTCLCFLYKSPDRPDIRLLSFPLTNNTGAHSVGNQPISLQQSSVHSCPRGRYLPKHTKHHGRASTNISFSISEKSHISPTSTMSMPYYHLPLAGKGQPGDPMPPSPATGPPPPAGASSDPLPVPMPLPPHPSEVNLDNLP